MGFFPDYTKPGPGIDKNAPKKKGSFLYFDLVWRYLWKFVQANMLYVAVSLPILLIYHYLFCGIFSSIYGAEADISLINHSAIIFTAVLAIFWGTGPASCGYTYILRGIAREEHVWVGLDFFRTIRDSFKHGLVFLIVDFVVFIACMVSISVYSSYALSDNILYIIPMYVVIAFVAFYTLMHFFIYEFEITFENKIREIYKNSMLVTIAAFPMCAVITAIIYFLTEVLLASMPSAVIVGVGFVIWIGLMRFMIDLYAARFIKRQFMTETKESEK